LGLHTGEGIAAARNNHHRHLGVLLMHSLACKEILGLVPKPLGHSLLHIVIQCEFQTFLNGPKK
jgi:hypothetical protein